MKGESSSHLIKQPVQGCLVSAELTHTARDALAPCSHGSPHWETPLPPSIFTPAWTELCPSLPGLREPPQIGLLRPQISAHRGYLTLAELITPLMPTGAETQRLTLCSAEMKRCWSTRGVTQPGIGNPSVDPAPWWITPPLHISDHTGQPTAGTPWPWPPLSPVLSASFRLSPALLLVSQEGECPALARGR